MPRVGDGSSERKGAAYGIRSTRSHDYSGTEQAPHGSRPLRSTGGSRVMSEEEFNARGGLKGKPINPYLGVSKHREEHEVHHEDYR
jgi:hypothetical protein